MTRDGAMTPRVRLGAGSIAGATLTAAVVLALGVDGLGGWVVAYLAVVALALAVPAAVTAQVTGGQLLAGAVWLQGGDEGVVVALLVIMTVIVTAELLAQVARLDSPLRRDPEGVLAHAGVSATTGGIAFAALAYASGLPGVGGLAAVAVGVVACVWVATRLVADA